MGLVYGMYNVCRCLLWDVAKREAWRQACFRYWAHRACRIIGVECTVVGLPPTPPFLLVCNHLSYVDIAVLASLVDARFIAKRDVASWRILGPPIRAAGTIFVDRNLQRDLVRVNDVIEDTLQKGEGVVFFPEGTSSPGANVLPFKPSLLDFAARRGYPVHYASISYRTPRDEPSADDTVCWWGDMEFPDHFMKFLEIPNVYASIVFGEKPLREPDRKVLADKLHQSVKEAFTPVIRKEDSCIS